MLYQRQVDIFGVFDKGADDRRVSLNGHRQWVVGAGRIPTPTGELPTSVSVRGERDLFEIAISKLIRV